MQSLRGMRDILPAESWRWLEMERRIHDLMARHQYGEIRTPVAESTELFVRGVGEDTDVVSKEMYTFDDRSGESITLRPENTAGCVRAAIEHRLVGRGATEKVYYIGPMFRYERPQRGRYRQFHQFGVEAYGIAGPQIEAEVILLARRLFDELGLLPHLQLEINSLGLPEERAQHRKALTAYFAEHREQLDDDSRGRLDRGNPMRILDSKNPAIQSLIEAAPKLADYLGDETTAHFDRLQGMLRAAGLPFVVNSRLVRGLDYYRHTVFEWTTNLLGSQGTVCGGGRYDGLFDEFGAAGVQGVGFGLGLERLLELCLEIGNNPVAPAPDVYLVAAGDAASLAAPALADELRAACPGLRVDSCSDNLGFKPQFKRANKSGARLALVVGDDELAQGTVAIKWLREDREQISVAREELSAILTTELGMS